MPIFSPLLRMMMTRQLRSLAAADLCLVIFFEGAAGKIMAAEREGESGCSIASRTQKLHCGRGLHANAGGPFYLRVEEHGYIG